jgi:hypothetical protein
VLLDKDLAPGGKRCRAATMAGFARSRHGHRAFTVL